LATPAYLQLKALLFKAMIEGKAYKLSLFLIILGDEY
jgi:hypothetical protein